MGVENSAQRGGPGCWNCVSCLLLYALDSGLWGDEGRYSEEQRKRVLCAAYGRGTSHCFDSDLCASTSHGRGWLRESASPTLDNNLPTPCGVSLSGGGR